MEISDREVFEWLLLSNRYAKTRNNHLEPAGTFDKTIEVLNRWGNKEDKIYTAKKILSELSLDTYFINEDIKKGPQARGLENSLRKIYTEYAIKLANIIDPKKIDNETQKELKKIIKDLGQKPVVR